MGTDAIRDLSEKIYEAVKDEDFETILGALVDQITFQMSLVCPGCRKNVARTLKRGIPSMLAHAARMAVQYDDPPASCH
jgi:hypothetical protein